jgi:hypothetical protein
MIQKMLAIQFMTNLESDSNVTDERDSHDVKHPEPRISTLRGRTID